MPSEDKFSRCGYGELVRPDPGAIKGEIYVEDAVRELMAAIGYDSFEIRVQQAFNIASGVK